MLSDNQHIKVKESTSNNRGRHHIASGLGTHLYYFDPKACSEPQKWLNIQEIKI